MKNLLLLLLMLSCMSVFSQNNRNEIRMLKSDLDSLIKLDDEKDTLLIKKKRKRLSLIKNYHIDSTKSVIYDFSKKEYTNSNVIPIVGQPLVLKIKNINRLAYDVSIKSSDVAIVDENFNNEIKTAVRAYNEIPEKLLLIDEKKISSPVIKKSEEDKKVDTNPAKIDGLNQEILKTKKNITEIGQNNIYLQEKIREKNKNIEIHTATLKKEVDSIKIVATIKNIKLENDSIIFLESEINKNKLEILKNENEIEIKTAEINKLKTYSEKVNSTFLSLNQKYLAIYKQYLILKIIDTEYQKYKSETFNPVLNFKTYMIERETLAISSIEVYKKEIFLFDELMSSFNDAYLNAMLNSYHKDENQTEYVKTKYQQIKDEVDKINSNYIALDLKAKLDKMEAIDNVLNNEKAYQITSAPIQPFEDYVTFDVKIKHRDPKRISEYDDNREFTYMEYTQGGVRFDFSTGVVFNFGGNNKDYEIRDVLVTQGGINENKKEIVLTSKNDFTPMLSGMFHTSFRRNGICAFGLTLGASLNVETFQLNSLFPGVSLLIGKKQKVIFTMGPALRQVEVLKSNYETNKAYELGEFNDTSQLTSNQFKVGYFFGITYNLTQKQKEKFKINGNQ